MVSLFFCIVKLLIVVGVQAKALKNNLLPIGSRVCINYQKTPNTITAITRNIY